MTFLYSLSKRNKNILSICNITGLTLFIASYYRGTSLIIIVFEAYMTSNLWHSVS